MKVVLSNSLRKRLLMMSDNVFAKALLGDTYCKEMLYLSDDKDDPGRITFIEPDKLKKYGYFFRWSKKRRSDRTAARTIRIIFPDIRDSFYEEFHNLFLSTISKVSKDRYTYRIVSGEDIRKYYHYINYADNTGSLGGSCMKGDREQTFLDIYTENPKNVNLCVALNKEGKVVARCLIWLVDGNTYFDRIYSINLEVEIRMHGYLTKKKFVQISQKNCIKPSTVPQLNIKLDAHDFKYYPYMDTLCFLTSRGVLNNNGIGDSLQATHGFRRDPITCAYSGRAIYDDIETVFIVAGAYTDQRVIKTFAVYSEFYKGYLIKNSACQEETTKDWYLRSDCRCSHDGKYYLANNPLLRKTEDDEYFIEGDPNILEINGKYYNKDSYRFSMEVNEPNITTTSLQTSDILDAIYRRIR